MKRVKYILLALGLVTSLSLASIAFPVAANPIEDFCKNTTNSSDSPACNKKGDSFPDFIKTLVNTLLYILGAVSVIVIIVAGIFYTTSSGNPEQVTQAKNTLMYAVIGVIVALLSYAIVNFVIGQLE